MEISDRMKRFDEAGIMGCFNDTGITAANCKSFLESPWISTKIRPAPPMETVQLCVDGKVIVGWNESIQPEEDPSYCSWEGWPESCISGEGVTHWAPLLKAPRENEVS